MSTYTVPVDGTMTKVEVPDGYKLLSNEHYQKLVAAYTVLSDLNRCEHGRHQGDSCNSCNGESEYGPVSLGNRFLADGQRIGTQLAGAAPIVAPVKGGGHFDSTDPKYWGYTA